MKQTIVISLGGSLVWKNDEIDTGYLKKFRKLVLNLSKKYRVVIVVGGGTLARYFNKSAKILNKSVTNRELDWMGIKATKVNAELIRIMFDSKAFYKIIDKPTTVIEKDAGIFVAGGWKPGATSDNMAVNLAVRFKAQLVINLTNISRVYTADPKKNKMAKPLSQISWVEFLKITGTKYVAGGNWPFDPIASLYAYNNGLSVAVIEGHRFDEVNKLLKEEPFVGTLIQ